MTMQDPIDGGLPRSAAEAGITDRFRYFRGRSGRRYLFTRIEPEAVGDYERALIVLTQDRGEGERIIWVDPRAARNAVPVPAAVLAQADAVYVHLLATRAEERRRIAADIDRARIALGRAA